MTVSFLVPAWNARAHLAPFVASFCSLSDPDTELVLCVGGDDGGHEEAERFESERIRVLLQTPDDGKQGALRKCLAHARGAIVYLTDVDCRLDDAVVTNLLQPLRRGDARVATGASRPLEEQLRVPLVRAHWAIERAAGPHEAGPVEGLLGRNAAVERSLLESLRAFGVPAPSGTDYTLAKLLRRAGYEILFVPGHPMPSEYPERAGTYVRKQARWLRNVVVLGTRYGATGEVLAVLPTLAMPIVLFAGLVAGMSLPSYALLLACSLLCGAAIVRRRAYQRRAGFPPDLRGSLLVFAADQAAALRAGWHVLTGRTTW